MTYRIDNIPNRSGKPSVLLRRHWREGTRIRKETIANLTRHPGWLVEGLRSLVDAGTARADSPGPVEIRRSRLLSEDTASSSLGAMLGLGEVSGNEVLGMLDWLLERQP